MIQMASSEPQHPLDPPQRLVRAEHEILIFLYFKIPALRFDLIVVIVVVDFTARTR